MSEEASLLKMPYLKSIVNALTDMVRIVSLEGRVLYTNKAYDRKLGNGQPSTGHICHEIFGGPCSTEDCVIADTSQRGHQQIRQMNDRMYSVSVSPLIGESGQMTAILEVFRDVTLDYNIKRNLLDQNTKMQQDLQLANKLQQAFTKTVMPVLPGYELGASFASCERVGGDMFDYIVRDGKLISYVADVSGHGVVPSMLAVFFSRAVDTACKLGFETPKEILDYVQAEFMELQVSDTVYITGFLIVLDIDSGDLLYTNAGLSVVPIISHGGRVRELVMESPPISRWFAGRNYDQREEHLEPGDRMLLFSDGIRELQEEEETLARFYDVFSAEPFSWRDFFYAVRRDFITRRQDDLTMLVLIREEAEERV